MVILFNHINRVLCKLKFLDPFLGTMFLLDAHIAIGFQYMCMFFR